MPAKAKVADFSPGQFRKKKKDDENKTIAVKQSRDFPHSPANVP